MAKIDDFYLKNEFEKNEWQTHFFMVNSRAVAGSSNAEIWMPRLGISLLAVGLYFIFCLKSCLGARSDQLPLSLAISLPLASEGPWLANSAARRGVRTCVRFTTAAAARFWP